MTNLRDNRDPELQLMQRMWLQLEQLPLAARRRVLVYLFARIDEMETPPNGEDHSQQQSDIEDMPHTSKPVVAASSLPRLV